MMQMQTNTFIHSISFPGKSKWVRQFNRCSELWEKSMDKKLSKKQRKEAADLWMEERQRLELGIY